jgi:hypothetical protein
MIYDCFTFFNELEILEIRLNILNKYVDKFVLVEATKNHQGKPKPLYFEENKSKFLPFKDKIIHIIVDDMPIFNGNNSWELEHYQRNNIVKGLINCNPNDIIIISDVDEIPELKNISFNDILTNQIYIFRQKMFYYYLNCINVSNNENYKWHGTVMTKFSKSIKPQELRNLSIKMQALYSHKWYHKWYAKSIKLSQKIFNQTSIKFVEDGGWHFSYLGGIDKIIQKLEAFAHTEYNKEEFKDPDKLSQIINSGKDIFNRNFNYKFIPIDDTFPEYIQKNFNKYPNLIKLNV